MVQPPLTRDVVVTVVTTGDDSIESPLMPCVTVDTDRHRIRCGRTRTRTPKFSPQAAILRTSDASLVLHCDDDAQAGTDEDEARDLVTR